METADGPTVREPERNSTQDEAHIPWHLKLLGGAFLVYVLLRLVQMGGWLIRWMIGQ